MQRSVCCIKAIRKLYTPGTGKSITDKVVRYPQGKPTVLPLFRMEKNTYPSTNGTAHDLNGHEVVYNPDQLELQLEGMLPTGVVTAKKESPVAETKQTQPSEKPSENQEEEKEEKKKAARYEETGHAINVNHFYELRQRLIGFGPTYVSPMELYTTDHMLVVYNQAVADMHTLAVAQAAKDVTTANLVIAFEGLKKKSTRAYNVFKICGAPATAVEKCILLNKKIHGERVEKIIEADGKNHISASQTSRPQLIKHLDALIELFLSYPEYVAPQDITAAAFTIMRDDMALRLQEGAEKVTTYKMALLQRNITMYKPVTGLVEIAYGSKNMTVGIYGFNSPQYNLVKGIGFSRIRDYKNL